MAENDEEAVVSENHPPRTLRGMLRDETSVHTLIFVITGHGRIK